MSRFVILTSDRNYKAIMLKSLNDLSRAQALGAYFDVFYGAAFIYFYGLNIRVPLAPRVAV